MTKQQKKWAVGIAAAIIAIMFATNPDQAAHMRAIRDTAALKPGGLLSITDLAPSISYNNYFLCSTTTIADRVVSWGAFGRVNTTNRVSDPFDINKK
jgi:hypothetical protein